MRKPRSHRPSGMEPVCLETESGSPGRTLVRQDRGRNGGGGEGSGVLVLRRQILNIINTHMTSALQKVAVRMLVSFPLYNGSVEVMNNTSCFHKAFRY